MMREVVSMTRTVTAGPPDAHARTTNDLRTNTAPIAPANGTPNESAANDEYVAGSGPIDFDNSEPDVVPTTLGEDDRAQVDTMRALYNTRSAPPVVLAQNGTPTTGGTNGTTTTPPAAAPSADAPLRRMEQAANRTRLRPVDGFITQQQIDDVQAQISRARTATQNGDYRTAEDAYRQLGYPVDVADMQNLPADQRDRALRTAAVLGRVNVTTNDDGSWQVSNMQLGRGGDQTLNDLNGLAANAHMMAEMDRAGVSPATNPPSEAEMDRYMQTVAANNPNDPQAVADAAGTVVDGTFVHYSSAGRNNPTYGRDGRRYVFIDSNGQRQSFDSQRAALDAARADGTPSSRVSAIETRVPNSRADAFRHGTRAGRTIGDCENKAYLYNRLLSSAGWTPVGAVNVQHGRSGHQLGVLRAPGGEVFVTSNQDNYRVQGTGPNGQVTQADLHGVSEQAIRDVYNRPTGSLDGFDFYYGREVSTPGAEPGTEALRRASENRSMRWDDQTIF